jgi:hypothetical protein
VPEGYSDFGSPSPAGSAATGSAVTTPMNFSCFLSAT